MSLFDLLVGDSSPTEKKFAQNTSPSSPAEKKFTQGSSPSSPNGDEGGEGAIVRANSCDNSPAPSSFPHCPRCLSYYLYRKNNLGLYECQTCGMRYSSEEVARRVQ